VSSLEDVISVMMHEQPAALESSSVEAGENPKPARRPRIKGGTKGG
jgi:hypothetical protein